VKITNQSGNLISANAEIARLMNDVRTAMGWYERNTPGFTEPTAIVTTPAVVTGALDLRSMFITPKASADSSAITYKKSPIVRHGNTSVPISATLLEHSLIGKAGATIILAALRNAAYGDRPNADKAAGPILMYRDAALFRIVEPATFGTIADGVAVTASPQPWSDALISWPDAPNLMFSVDFTRQQLKGIGGQEFIEECLLESIVLGLANAADSLLLNAIVDANPAPFSLGAVAARNLRFADLSAIIGTAGIGAAVGQDGVLRADGIAGDLTKAIAQTLIGDWKKAAVAVYPDVTVHFVRTNTDGSMQVQVLANALPLVPDATAFWVGV